MEIKTWAPFFPDIDKEWRLFDFPRLAREMSGFEFRPSVDVVKEDDSLRVVAELPGLDSDDVEVSLDGDVLTIKGEKTEEKEISEDDRYLHERTFGKFQRHIQLPSGIDADDVSADFDKGVLTVRVALPKEATAEPRRIPVAAKTSS